MSCFNELVKNAVPIETHGEKKQGTSKENVNLKQVYVLVSATRDEAAIYPIQLEVKEFYDVDAKLYLNVVLTKIEAEVVETTSADNVGGPSPLVSASTISLRQLFQNVNQRDGRFLKYVPDGFLNSAQKQAKQDALQRQSEEYASYEPLKFSARDYAEQADAQFKEIVKYQERSIDSISNRSLLANALETAA